MRWFWIDRFREFVSGSHAVAVKNVSLAEEHLHDHFPGFPVMPGSLIVEGMAQAGGLLVSEHYRFSELVVLGKVARFEVVKLPRPGDTVTYRCQIEQLKDGGAMVQSLGHVDDRQMAEANIFFARMGAQPEDRQGDLFSRHDLFHWLNMVGVFEVGRTPQGDRLTPDLYGFTT